MYLKRRFFKYFLAAVVGAVLYCEWFIYLAQPWYWEKLECGTQDKSCTKVLLVADPQIQGDLAVSPPLSYLYNWDSDRYIKTTFSVITKHFKPDVIVYLGDLMDEGSVSTIQQFHGYVKRLFDIFDINYPVVQIWLPGDNDIGGENESVKKDKIDEFNKVFNQPEVIAFRNISFYKINGITHTIPKFEQDNNNFRIAVSHYPLLSKQMFAKQVLNDINPNIMFCAHDHESKYVTQSRDFTNKITHSLNSGDKALNLLFDDATITEIFVPTSSYRMGTDKIGFGAALIESNNQRLRYTVFWSPTRFPYLIIYLCLVIFLTLYFIIFCAARLFYRNSNHMSQSKQHLLERL